MKEEINTGLIIETLGNEVKIEFLEQKSDSYWESIFIDRGSAIKIRDFLTNFIGDEKP